MSEKAVLTHTHERDAGDTCTGTCRAVRVRNFLILLDPELTLSSRRVKENTAAIVPKHVVHGLIRLGPHVPTTLLASCVGWRRLTA